MAQAEAKVAELKAQSVAQMEKAKLAAIPEDQRFDLLKIKCLAGAYKSVAPNFKHKLVTHQHLTDPKQMESITNMVGANQMKVGFWVGQIDY